MTGWDPRRVLLMIVVIVVMMMMMMMIWSDSDPGPPETRCVPSSLHRGDRE